MKVKKIVVHCTDSPDTLDIGAREIDAWHRERGFREIGYHYVIRRSGVMEPGRLATKPGAHVKGHNHNTLGVVWVGRDRPTADQWTVLTTLCVALIKGNRLAATDLVGHRELAPLAGKTCPNINMQALRVQVAATLQKETA